MPNKSTPEDVQNRINSVLGIKPKKSSSTPGGQQKQFNAGSFSQEKSSPFETSQDRINRVLGISDPLSDFKRSLDPNIIKSVQDKYRSQWGDKYYYDITDADDLARMNAGQMPKYLANKYKANDPYDRWLYENNLPSTKDFNDMYSQAVLDYNEQQQTRSGQLQNIINSLDQFDKQRAAFLQGKATGKTPGEMLATGDYDAFNAYYKEPGKEEMNPYKARQNAAGSTDYSAFDKVYDALYSNDPNKLNEALTDDFWNNYSDKEWQKYLNQKLAWNESDNDRQLQIAADQSKRVWNKAKSDYDKQVEKARADYIASLPEEQQAAYQQAVEAEQAVPAYQAVSDRIVELRKEIRRQQHYVKDLGHDPAALNAAQDEYNKLVARRDELETSIKNEDQQRMDEIDTRLGQIRKEISRHKNVAIGLGLESTDEIDQLQAEADALKEERAQYVQKQRDQSHAEKNELYASMDIEAYKEKRLELKAKKEEELAALKEKMKNRTSGLTRNEAIAQAKQLEFDIRTLDSETLDESAAKATQLINSYIDRGLSTSPVDVSSWKNKTLANQYLALTGQESNLPQDQLNAIQRRATFLSDTELEALNGAASLGEEEAKKYIKALQDIGGVREQLDLSERVEDWARDNPGLASAASVPASALSSVEGIASQFTGNAAQIVGNSFMTTVSKSVRNAVSSQIIAENSTESSVFRGKSNGEIYSFVYQTGMSIADSLFRNALLGLAGSAGATQADLESLGNIGLMVAGGSAASNTVLDNLLEGRTTRQALSLAAVGGIAEILTEKVSLDSLIDTALAGRSAESVAELFMRTIPKQMIAEGSEEFFSESINILAEAIILGEPDDLREKKAELMRRGYTESQATALALLSRVGGAFMGGALSGGAFGLGGFVGQINSDFNANREANILKRSIGSQLRAQMTKDAFTLGLADDTSENSIIDVNDYLEENAPWLLTTDAGQAVIQYYAEQLHREALNRQEANVKATENQQKALNNLTELFDKMVSLQNEAKAALANGDTTAHATLIQKTREAMKAYTDASSQNDTQKKIDSIRQEKADAELNKRVNDLVDETVNKVEALKANVSEMLSTDQAGALAALGDQLAKAEAVDSIETDDINSAKAQAMENGDTEAYNLLDDLVNIQRSGNEEAKARFADEHADLMNMLVGTNDVAQQSIGVNNNIQEEMVNANSNGRNGQPAEAGSAGPEGSEINLLDNQRGRNIGDQAERTDTEGLREREGDNGSGDAGNPGTGPARSWLGVDHTRLFNDVAKGYNKDHKLFGKNRIKASDFQILTEPTNERSADILAKTIARNGGKSVYLYRSTNPNAPNGFFYKGNIYINDTGDGLVAFYYAHEYAHNNGNENAIQTAGRRVWQEMQGEGSDALDRYCKKWGEEPNDPKIMNEFIADIRGAYEYAIQNNHEVYEQLGLTAEEAKRFNKAFAEVDGQVGATGESSQQTDFSNHNIKNTKTAGATPLSRGLTPHGAGSVGLTERFMTAASTLGINNLSNVDEKVKHAIVKLSDAFESAKNNRPIDNSFKKAVSADNLVGALVKCGLLTRESAESAYFMNNDMTLRLSNHSSNVGNFRTGGENLSVVMKTKGVSTGTFKPNNQTKVIEAVFSKTYLNDNPDKLLTLIKDIAGFVATGEYHDNVGAYDVRYSGNNTYVTAAQDRMYSDAIRRGDTQTLEQFVSDAAHAAMPDSKILDEDGNLMVVYHGTDQDFRSFDMSKGRSTMDIQGAFFSPWELDASGYGPNVGKYYLNVTNPAPEGVAYAALNRFKGQNEAGRKAREFLISKGYDGVNNGDEEYIAFYPSQIKSADPVTYAKNGKPISLSERFNDKEDDFNYSSHSLIDPGEAIDLNDPKSFTYDEMIKAKPMVVSTLDGEKTNLDRKELANVAVKSLQDAGTSIFDRNAYRVINQYTKVPVGISRDAVRHGFDRRISINSIVASSLGELLENAFPVNRYSESDRYLSLGLGQNDKNVFGIIFEIDRKTGLVIEANTVNLPFGEVVDHVHSYNTRKIDSAASNGQGGLVPTESSEISIEDFLNVVHNNFSDILPQEVLDHYGKAKTASRYSEGLKFSSHNLREGTNAIEDAVIRNARTAQDLYNRGVSVADYMAHSVYDPEVARQLGGIERRNTPAPTGLTRAQRAQMFQWDRERLDNQLRNMKASERAAVLREREKMQQRQDREKYGSDVVKRSRDLMKWMTSPNVKEGKYVPDFFKDAVSEVLQGIDLGSNDRVGGQKAQSWRRSLMNLATTLQQYKAHQEGRVQDGRFEGMEMDLPDGFVEDFTDLANSITEEGTNFLQDMDADRLRRLDKSIAILQSGIRNANRMHANARYATVSEAADATIQEQEGRRKYKNSGVKVVEAVRNLVNSEMLDLESYAQRLGDAGGSVMRSIANGFLKGTTHIKEAQEFFENAREKDGITKKDVHSWTKNTVTQQLDSGETISMTEGQLMNLYALSARQQAMSHILQGGIELAYNKASKGNQNRAYQLTYGDLDNLFSHLSDKQKRFVADLQRYLSETASGWGNEVSQELYGIDMYGEEFYWPIRSAKAGLATQDPEKVRAFNAIQNSSFTNAVIRNASNPITLDDCVQTFCDHVAQMANYNGMAIPIGDAMKWFNYKSKSEEGAPDWNRSVKRSITDVMGKDGTSYFINLIKDINGLSEGGTGTNLPSALVANTKKAAVAAKIRVMIQQPTAVVRAMSMINPKYFAGFDDLHLKDVVKEMQENAPIAWWKAQGNFDIGTGKSMRDIISGDASAYENFVNATMAGAGAMDDLGWSWIWNAVKREQKARHPGMSNEQLMPAIVDRFTDVINKTQVIDTVVHRSQIMRSKDSAVKQSTAFMSEPIKTFNLLHNALNDVIEGRPGAKKRLGKTVAAVAGSWALNAAVLALHDALKYRDEDDDLWDLIQQYWKDNFIDNFNQLNAIPYIKDVIALAQGESLERMDMSAIADLIDSAQAIGKYLKTGSTGYTDYGLTRKFMTALGNVFGTPLTGLLADAELVVNAVAPGSVLTKKTKNWDKADALIEQGINKKQARGLMKNYDGSTNASKALSILTYDGNRDGKPDFDKQQQDLIAEILGISYAPEKDGTLEAYARKNVDSYMKKKEKLLEKGEITEEQYDGYQNIFDTYFELLG